MRWQRYLSMLCTLMLVLTMALAPITAHAARDLGDVDGSGGIDANDASDVLVASTEEAVGHDPGLTAEQRTAADVDHSGTYDAVDASYILVYSTMKGTGHDVTFDQLTGYTPPPQVVYGQSYTTPEDVALYIYTYGALPANYITKSEAQALGWVSTQGNLWDVAPGKSIGGDYFGNREGLLPTGSYHECDVNYAGGYRQSERLVYSTDRRVYYTNDHYVTFTQLY